MDCRPHPSNGMVHAVSYDTYLRALYLYVSTHSSDLCSGSSRLTLTLSGVTLLFELRNELQTILSQPQRKEKVKEIKGIKIEKLNKLYIMLAALVREQRGCRVECIESQFHCKPFFSRFHSLI